MEIAMGDVSLTNGLTQHISRLDRPSCRAVTHLQGLRIYWLNRNAGAFII